MPGKSKPAGARRAGERRKDSPARISPYDIVAVGASAGGLFAVSEVLRRLPADFPASVILVQHLSPRRKSNLSELLGHITGLKVEEANDGTRIMAGVVYVAPPDQHLLLEKGRLKLAHSEAVRFLRPSIDLMFESVANECGSRCIALVLSGALRDGSMGMCTVKKAGGLTLVEDPSDAEFPSMPMAAMATGCVDKVVPLVEIGPALIRLCRGEANVDGR